MKISLAFLFGKRTVVFSALALFILDALHPDLTPLEVPVIFYFCMVISTGIRLYHENRDYILQWLETDTAKYFQETEVDEWLEIAPRMCFCSLLWPVGSFLGGKAPSLVSFLQFWLAGAISATVICLYR